MEKKKKITLLISGGIVLITVIAVLVLAVLCKSIDFSGNSVLSPNTCSYETMIIEEGESITLSDGCNSCTYNDGVLDCIDLICE